MEQEPRPCERENRPSHGCSRILSPIFAQQAMRHVLVLCTTEAHWSRSARRTLGTGAVHAHGMDRLSLDIAAASTRRASPSPFRLVFFSPSLANQRSLGTCRCGTSPDCIRDTARADRSVKSISHVPLILRDFRDALPQCLSAKPHVSHVEKYLMDFRSVGLDLVYPFAFRWRFQPLCGILVANNGQN